MTFTHLTFESLEDRRLMSVAVDQGGDKISDGETIGSNPPAHLSFGFFRQGTSGDARSINYSIVNPTASPLRVTHVAVPAGFTIITAPAPTTDIAPYAESPLVIRMDKNQPGHHQGNVVIDSNDGETFRFEIEGTVGDYAAAGANNLGSLGSAHRAGALQYYAESDYSGSAVLNPGIALFRFDLAAPRNDVTLSLTKPAGSDSRFVDMAIYRDANDDGILQVGEETPIFPAAHVEGVSAGDPAQHDLSSGALTAGSYLVKCSPPTGLPEFSVIDVAYDFTLTATPQPDPAITVQTTGADFGSATVGSTTRRQFVVKNTGNAPLNLSPAAFLTANTGFSIDAGLPPTLAPGASAVLGVRMDTSAAGAKSAQIHIPSNDPHTPDFNFAVHGTVTPASSSGTNPAPTGTPPTATLLTALRVRSAGGTFYKFTIRYADPDRVDLATIDSDDITVSGPNGFSSGVRLLSTSSKKGGKRIDAFYRLAAPGGTWDRGDNGLYTIHLNSAQIADTAGAAAPTTDVGQFTVRVPKSTGVQRAVATTPFATQTSRKLMEEEGIFYY